MTFVRCLFCKEHCGLFRFDLKVGRSLSTRKLCYFNEPALVRVSFSLRPNCSSFSILSPVFLCLALMFVSKVVCFLLKIMEYVALAKLKVLDEDVTQFFRAYLSENGVDKR